MNTSPQLLAFFVPLAILLAFAIHWLSLRPIKSSAERLVLSRGAYLGLSSMLVLFAWALVSTSPAQPLGGVLLALGMTASFLGDFCNLQFPGASRRLGQPLAFGIGAFMLAQVFYIAAFLSLIPLAELRSKGGFLPILAVLVIVPALIFRFRVFSPDRPRALMVLAFIYGFLLGAMAAVAISASIARGGAWIALGCGAASFMVSDAVFGDTTIRGVHPVWEFQVPWITYLLAQGLLIGGFALAGGLI